MIKHVDKFIIVATEIQVLGLTYKKTRMPCTKEIQLKSK